MSVDVVADLKGEATYDGGKQEKERRHHDDSNHC